MTNLSFRCHLHVIADPGEELRSSPGETELREPESAVSGSLRAVWFEVVWT
jgi:hypothetical protein